MKLLKPILGAAIIAAAFTSANAQWVISSLNTTFTENFDSLGSSATASLPNGWKVAGNGATPDYSTGTTATTRAGGTSGTGILTSTSGGGTYNFANGVTASSTDRAVGFLTSGSYASPDSLMVQLQNTSGSTVGKLDVSYDIEKYRSGSRAFDVNFFYSTDGSTWTSASSGDHSFAADANNTVVSNPPITTSISQFSISGINVANNSTIYLRWAYTGSGGSSNAQGLGFDNINVMLEVPEPSSYAAIAGLGLIGFGVWRRARR
ncbi:MAG TPA: PEP-CTERM sorting domain-containing protein [Candidatus Limnocylindria bacterium]|jgi:hypothetical protein|nr:PEP-CTERM sorting domain-containing protein [Candidatus Limnocylindria bacterium]